MPSTTRSASRLANLQGTAQTTSTPKSTGTDSNVQVPQETSRKRKAESAVTKEVKKVSKKEDPSPSAQPALIPPSSSAEEDATVPAVLSFAFEEAKNHLIEADHRFEDLFEKMKCKPFEQLERVHPFQALAKSILGQQISWLAARSITHKFLRLYQPSLPEKPTEEERKAITFFPSPYQVATTGIDTLRTAGLSARKAEYIKDLATRFADGRLSTEKLLAADDEELARMLIEVRGIGRWTVDMFAIFSLRRPDILPVGDLGVQRGMVRWFLSLHSAAHPFSISPEKVGNSANTKTKKSQGEANEHPSESLVDGEKDDDMPVDSSSAPPGTSEGEESSSIPPPFTPSIKKTLSKPAATPGKPVPPLPSGIDVKLLKSRLDGKNKVKGAFLTPQEMNALSENWKPYRSVDPVALHDPRRCPRDKATTLPSSTPMSPSSYSTNQPIQPSSMASQNPKSYSTPEASSSVGPVSPDHTSRTTSFSPPQRGLTGITHMNKASQEGFDAGGSEGNGRRTLSESMPRLRRMLSYSTQLRQSSPSPTFPLLAAAKDQLAQMHDASFTSPDTMPDAALRRPSICQEDAPENGLQLHLNGEPSPELKLPRLEYSTEAHLYSSHFPAGHHLNSHFAQTYQLEDELGSGGYGFVMAAYHRIEGHEVAVKFIIKDKVPEHAWMEDEVVGRLPTEVVLMSYVNHPNIVKCLDLFEDHLYFYLVQELHGSPWHKNHRLDVEPPTIHCYSGRTPSVSTPALSPSSSEASLPASTPCTPPHVFATIKPHSGTDRTNADADMPKLLHTHLSIAQGASRPEITRRASHDLFECIEQSECKRLTESQARYVFAQVVDAVEYLEGLGITHRDIKDENLVIDQNLKVKLIDFGSATAVDPTQPRPYYTMFYGTAAYASSEILLKKDYQAAPAEIWTLGVLLSYLLAGISPFPTVRDAVDGKIFLSEKVVGKISEDAMDLMQKCLDANPETRATISQVKAHRWLQPRQLL
ncbi:unnamed protein product [Cyclocybe aegerita]|uniref:Protein kinase domain-containing protein n=1 Tax=Cyclocybe aegerita TaxID=1973307 RepID=A0A8S0WAJ1_CYCAE|nr:unnamed protein product [Cyclocybe aegerita]